MIAIDALGPDGEYRTRNRQPVTAADGAVIAELTLAPTLYVARAIKAQRGVRPLPAHEREAALTKAADIFAHGVIAGLDFDAYTVAASRISGLPISVTRTGAHAVADGVASSFSAIQRARPSGAVLNWRDIGAGGAAWARRGDVFAVLASGNGPGVHGLWPQALALGYRVAVRPSRREPLTAHRLVQALRQAGFRPQDALYLPTDHRGGDELIRSADLAMVYGGQDVVDKYAGDPTVFVNGPGRAKILITADHNWRDYLDVVVDSIADLGGVACVNATAVLYEGDPAPLAEAITERLSAIDHEVLPVQTLDAAMALASHVATVAAGSTALLGADQMVAPLGDGHAALRPTVHLLATPDVNRLNVELPFPCVWVAPWSRADGLEPLRHSLVISAITDDGDLIDDLLADPTIANVYGGRYPTHYTAPEIPHDGFLADFLMRNKGFIRD
ncbi:aldehyde dehydrogenase [Mycobacterium sp. 1245111.1]|uniref:aldehyde dehydrogenase family protein n=1 Tax=Mycobacterium sp. 1245111.1 TaxID=1834073 RepID=UPI0007FBD450|nr:aldehyde dehydrogenase family protein [Mycobacterium sp. 1245111.1]OBK35666.1 aldehyde dehydrogenase [Mycobacterium sp. 1245111.1]